ncbi:MAG: aminodeoxychorismate lyase [Clostridiales bacterium]|nr:aminodeoxychorismate lyase [Clostridiales bacterium]
MNLNKMVFKFVRFSFSILVTLLVVACLIKLGASCYEFGYRVFTEKPMEEAPGTDKVVEVTADMSEIEIGKLLEKNGLVRDEKLFYAQLKLSAYSGKLRPGTYTLNTSMTAKEMMVVMTTVLEEDTETETESEAKAAT